ncbi:sulfotransferase domain-containing protein [Polynucleobacter paneuropaeus]|jgi:hypothetical protein|nr:sulfotransferase domain-containing protein [Polynucleobacter paneuropaeus]
MKMSHFSKLKIITTSAISKARYCLRQLTLHEQLLLTPTAPRNDDLYLVSFPKSGTTWVNFLVANINAMMSNQVRKVTYYNINDFVPDIHLSRSLPDPSLPFPGFRFIKSHSVLNIYYCNVVYIIRDPRDTLLSYYHFTSKLGLYSGSLSDFLKHKEFGIHAWVRHVNSWFNLSPASLNFMFLKYEDLKENPQDELTRLYSQLGFDLPQLILDSSILKSSFANMKLLEQSLNYGSRSTLSKFNFMRKGNVGDGLVAFSQNDLNYIEKYAGDAMSKFGYV